MSGFDFNVFDEKYAPGSDLINDGHHEAIIAEAEIRATKKNIAGIDKSQYLYLEFAVTENKGFKGRKVFEYMNIYNSNKSCEERARERLQTLAVAVGVTDLKNPRDLVNRAVLLDVGTDKSNAAFPKNIIKKFMEIVKQELPSSQTASTEKKADEFDDDVPF